jgi:hypothetical protein
MNSKELENINLIPLRSQNHFKSHIAPYSIGALGAVGSLTGILDSIPDQVPKMWFWLTLWVIGILIPLLVGSYSNSNYGSTSEAKFQKVLVEREILRAGILILQRDHLTDREIAALDAMSSRMDDDSLRLSMQERRKVVDCAFRIACANRNFRQREQNALNEIISKYGLQNDKEIKAKFASLVSANPEIQTIASV